MQPIPTPPSPPPPRLLGSKLMRSPVWRLPRLGAVVLALMAAALLLPLQPVPEASAQSAITYSLDSNLYNVREGDNLRAKILFSAPLPSDQTLSVTTSGGGTAVYGGPADGNDVEFSTLSIVVPEGATEYDFQLYVNQDNVIEPTEKLLMTLSDESAVLTKSRPGTAVVRIFNVTVVPDDWALLPSGVNPGQQFRLLFVSDAYGAADTTLLNTYRNLLRDRVSNHGHADIRAHASGFEAVISTVSVDAHRLTGTGSDAATQWNTPIYWLNGNKIAGYHADFWDGTWEAGEEADARAADGDAPSDTTRWIWTGTQNGGTKSDHPMGNSPNVTYGDLGGGANPIAQGTSGRGGSNPFYGISQVFQREGRRYYGAQPQEVFFAGSEHHVTEGDKVQITLRLRYAELTPTSVMLSTDNPPSITLDRISDKIEPAESEDYAGFTDRQFTIPAGHTSYSFEIQTVKDELDEERMETFRVQTSSVSDVPFGQPGVAFVHISDMPKVVLSRENIAATEASSCADSVGSHGDVFRSEQYTIKLDRSPGPGKFVSVEIWEPSDMAFQTGFDRFRHYSYIFGTPQWPRDMAGRVSIENTPTQGILNRFNTSSLRYESTILTFFESDWDNAKTVTVRLHCAAHGTGALPIYHFAFRHSLPVGVYDSGSFIRGHWYNGEGTRTPFSRQSQRRDWKPRSDDSRANTTHRIAWVKVTDNNPPNPSLKNSNIPGKLAFDLTSPIFGSVSGGSKFETFPTEWLWKNDPLVKNDYADAARNFSGFRVRVRTEGHPDQEIHKPVHQIVNRQISGWYYGDFHALGSVLNLQQPPRAFEFSVVPVDKNGDNVEPERVTICRDFKKRAWGFGYLDLNSRPACPPAPPTPMNSPGGGGQGSPPSNPGPGQGGGGVSGGPGQALPSPVGPPEAHAVSDVTLTSMTITWRDRDNVGTYFVVWADVTNNGESREALVFDNSYTITGLEPDTEYAVIVFSSDNDRISTVGRHRTLALDHTTDLEKHYAGLIADIKSWRDHYSHSTQASYRRPFNRALLAFGVTDFTNDNARYQRLDQADALLAPMTAEEAQAILDSKTEPWDLQWWGRITAALTEIEAIPPAPANAGPVISVAADGDVTEGSDASFTVTADPAPTADLDVSVTVSQSGDYGVTTGAQTVTIPTTGTYTLTVPTTGDDLEEADGSVTVTVDDGTGYTVSSNSGAATVVVSDDDAAAAVCTPQLPDDAVTVEEVTAWRDKHSHKADHVARWNQVLAALGVEGTGETPMTSAESKANESRFIPALWNRVTRTLEALEECAGPAPTPAPDQQQGTGQSDSQPTPTPEVSVTAGGGITEGGDASFTITANPAPTSALTVSVTVSQSGDYGAATGAQTVTIPTTGSYILTVATSDDGADEADGSVTATIDDGTGYTVSSTAGAATVAVADDDVPEISIAAGGGITEGGDASFTITADPAPHAALPVSVSVSQSGDYGVTTGAQTVTIPTTGSYTLTISTTGDSQDEADGSVTATVDDGTGYTVSSSAGAATVAVADDDDPPAASDGHAAAVANGSVTIAAPDSWTGRGRPQVTGGAHRLDGWTGIQFSVSGLGSPPAALTVSWASRPAGDVSLPLEWQPVAGSDWQSSDGGPIGLTTVKITDPAPTPTPEVSVTAGGGITEGGDASFTITANPAPTSALTVSVTVTQSGDYGVATGKQTVTIPIGGSYTLTVATAGDSKDEADGSVTATVNTGDGYTVSSGSGAATVAVADDDDPTPAPPAPTPEVSIAAGGGITEGGDAAFTITANPAPTSALTVGVTVSQSGDYGVATGKQTVTIPTGGSYTLTVATSDDGADEADGSVTATVNTGDGYTVSSGSGAATVAVSDDDVPEISVSAGGGITEGGDASFTITANPAPHAALPVKVSVSQSGDYGVAPGSRTVTIPTSGSYTLAVPTYDDSNDEADGSVTVTVNTGDGYTVSTTANSATVSVSDDDDPPPPPSDEVSVSVNDASAREDAGTLDFVVSLSKASDAEVRVQFTTALGTADKDADYVDYHGWLTFAPGETRQAVSVELVDDAEQEGDETVWVWLNFPTGGAVLGDRQGVGAIVDDD